MATPELKLVEDAKAAIVASASLGPDTAISELERKLSGAGWNLQDIKTSAEKEKLAEKDDMSLAFRTAVEQLLTENSKAGKDSIQDKRVVALLDLSMHAALKNWVPRQLPCMVMHDWLEAQSADQCSQTFSYLEQRADKLRDLTMNGEHSYCKAALLKCCNTLMHRLSKASSLLLCGRVLMLLAHVLPLTERSGVNDKGKFNTATADIPYSTELEGVEAERLKAEGGDAAAFKLKSTDEKLDGQMEVSFALYKTFWGLQKVLHDPMPLIMGTDSVEEFVQSISRVLEHLATYSLEAEADDMDSQDPETGAQKPNGHVPGGVGAGAGVGAAERHFDFPGFLTDTKLIALEFQDPIFRRQILVQLLIVLHYLLDRSVHPAKSPELSRKSISDLTDLQQRCYTLLLETPPRARSPAFVASLKVVLQRENNWTSWKKAKCPEFEKVQAEKSDGPVEVGDKRKDTFEALGAYKRRFFSSKIRTEFIPPTLKSGNIMEICKVKDRKLQKRLKAGDTDYHPQEIENRLDIVKMEADPENDIDEVFRKNNIPCWRWVTLRMLASYDINLFESCTMDNKWLEGVVKQRDRDAAKAGTTEQGSGSELGGKGGMEGRGGGGGSSRGGSSEAVQDYLSVIESPAMNSEKTGLLTAMLRLETRLHVLKVFSETARWHGQGEKGYFHGAPEDWKLVASALQSEEK